MRAVLLGKHKRSAVAALDHLLARGVEVAAVVAPQDPGGAVAEQRLDLAADRSSLPLVTDELLYATIADPAAAVLNLDGVDLVLSFLFWKRIRPPLISHARIGCLNFHPAPLPDVRGVGGYNVAVLEGRTEWGVSAHFVDEHFDTGDLVRVERFPIDATSETALSLDIKSQQHLLGLFRDVVDRALAGEELPRAPQGAGRYVTREEFEALRHVRRDDPPELTERRIRAFWYPPFEGATIDVAGRELTLVNRSLLKEAAEAYRQAGIFP